MNQKNTKLFFTLIISLFYIVQADKCNAQSNNPTIDQQVSNLYSKLTLEDKINLISGSEGMQAPGIVQLGIPALKMTDGPYGPHWEKAPGIPVGVCLAATWDTSLIYQAGVAMGKFTRAQGRNTLLGPCVNIHRVPNGGRNFESYSEDPFLASRMAVAVVKGLQSQHVIPTVKHFALNNNEWNRHLSDARVDERALREIYLPAFEAAVKEAGAWGIMSSYNKIRGVHASENDYLLNQILKKEWGFKGIVVSDWASVYSTIGPVKGGLDVEMPNPVFFAHDSIMKYLKSGQITEEMINDKARRNLYVRVAAGLTDTQIKNPDRSIQQSAETNNLIRTLAEKGIVLLKNENSILPLNKENLKTIAMIGPNANILRSGGGGSSHIEPFYTVSPVEGIKNFVGNKSTVLFALGDTLAYQEISAIPANCLFQPDGQSMGLKAEYFNNEKLEGEPAFSTVDTAVNFTWNDRSPAPGVARDNYSARWTGFLTPKVSGWYILKFRTANAGMVYIDGKPAIDRMGRMDATPIVMRRYFEAGKKYNLRVEIFVGHGWGQSILGWISPVKNPANAKLMEAAVAAAKKADVAVVCVGWEKMFETEGYDKEEGLTLPGQQEELIKAVTAVNPNTVVVINSGTSVWMDSWESKVKGIVMAFYPGHEGGNALANILFGAVNPSGKLPFTFIRDSSQSPAFKNYMNVNPIINYEEGLYVGYRFTNKNNMKPRFPFGFGLSYSTFKISNAKVTKIAANTFEVIAKVENTGKLAGEEVVQVYVSDKTPGVDRPLKELKAFSKISLNPGESKYVKLLLKPRSFAYYNVMKKDWVIEPGKYLLILGNSSEDAQQMLTVKL
jgi:beta-glucosidase